MTENGSKGLLEPVLEHGIQNTHYFNGRLLTAQDLQVDQLANRAQHQQMGRGIGEGIIHGFEVRLVSGGAGGQPPVLSVEAGLALSGTGQIVSLPKPLPELLLARRNPDILPSAGIFAECDRPSNESPTTTASIHVLTVRLASGFSGKAPKRGFGENGKVEGCGSRYAVEGVYFRLVELNLIDLTFTTNADVTTLTNLMNKTDAASLSLLRNHLAHLCFGTDQLGEFQLDPFRLVSKRSAYASYGAIDDLRTRGLLTACDVPLALVFWSATGVRFVDMWSVRRRVVQPVVGDPWPLHVGERRIAESEAIFLQFQEQLLQTMAESGLPTIKATDRFRYLPAAGYLPIDTGEFTVAGFFQGLQRLDLDLDSAFLRRVVHNSWYDDPIDLSDPPPILIYRSSDNPDYILFARGERLPADDDDQDDEPVDTSVKTGTFVVDLRIRRAVETILKRGDKDAESSSRSFGVANPKEETIALRYYTDLLDGKTELDRRFVTVYARDEKGNEYAGKHVPTRLDIRDRQSKDIAFDDGVARFTIDGLPPGSYHVIAELKGFAKADQLRTVGSGQKVFVTFDLVARTTSGSKPTYQPPISHDATWVDGGWFGKATIIEELIRWPLPDPDDLIHVDPLDDPLPDEIELWLTDVAGWLQVAYPDAPVDPGGIQVLLDPSHTPESTPDDAYAYVVFGEQGAYVPVVLTPVDQTLDREIALDKSQLAGIDQSVARQMETFGLKSVDVLSASWKGLVSGVLGIDNQAAGSLVSDARQQVTVLQDSLLGLGGVDSTLNETLIAAGFDTPVAVANATPAAIVAAAGDDVVTTAYAERLIADARRTVAADQWSLESAQLGLKEDEIASLNALDVTTLQAFKELAGSAAGRESLAEALEVSTEQITALDQRVVIKSAADLATDRLAAGAVTGVFGVNSETGRRLAGMGIATVGRLAEADPEVLASVFGGQRDIAESAINSARNKLGIAM